MAIQRRAFVVGGLGTVALGAGTYAWLRARGYEVDPRPSPIGGEPRAPAAPLAFAPFDTRALAILTYVVHQLLPGDATLGLPSAEEAGVLDFVVRAAALPGLMPVRNDILKLTRHLDLAAQPRGDRYDKIDDAGRDAILEAARRGEGRRSSFDPRRALEALLRLCLEGYLGHPRHGGNQGAQVWAALEIDMPVDVEAGHGGHVP